MHEAQKLINHVALVLDASWSMNGRQSEVVKVTDEQIKHLALRSEELNQETRVSVYRFGETTIECLIFDMDVMRLPSTSDLYGVLRENTALIDATLKSQEDLSTTSELYGDHAFLTFVLTDGQENRSRRTAAELRNKIVGLPENWSLAFLVPNASGVAYMERLGMSRDSIAQWDIASSSGLVDAVSTIRVATDNFMTNRAAGVRGTRGVFSTGADAVNKETVTQNLQPIPNNEFGLYRVPSKTRIDEFVNSLGMNYVKGAGYYQLTKTETIQANKHIVVVEKGTTNAYGGKQARALIGLPDNESVRVKPDENPKYEIFVQSTSLNRNLMPNTRLFLTNV